MLTNPHEQHSWNKNQFITFTSHEHNLKLITLRVWTNKKERKRVVTLRKWFSTIFLKASKLEMEWNGEDWKILWSFEESNGVHVKERKKRSEVYDFLKSTINKPPYYANALAHSWPLDQKTKCQDKTLAIGSKDKTIPLEITLITS